jgi:hypothetical protein
MEIVHCDGGEFDPDIDEVPEDFDADNLLRNEPSVYCSKRSTCNILLRHEQGALFDVSKIIIKAPEAGYTAPLTQGLVFVGMNEMDLRKSAAEYRVMYRKDGESIPRPPPFITDEQTRLRHREMSEYLSTFVGEQRTQPPADMPTSMFPTGLGIDWSRFDWENFSFEGFLHNFPDFVSRLGQRHMLTHPERVTLSDFMKGLTETVRSDGDDGYQPSSFCLTTAGPEWDSEMEDVDCDGHSDNGEGIDAPLPMIRSHRTAASTFGKNADSNMSLPRADFYLKTGKTTAALHFKPAL